MFPRVYEIKNKFRYKIHTDSTKIKIKRDLFSCVVETVSGFQMIRSMLQNKLRVKYRPIDIVFDHVKHHKQNINCCFTITKHLAYRTLFSIGRNKKN